MSDDSTNTEIDQEIDNEKKKEPQSSRRLKSRHRSVRKESSLTDTSSVKKKKEKRKEKIRKVDDTEDKKNTSHTRKNRHKTKHSSSDESYLSESSDESVYVREYNPKIINKNLPGGYNEAYLSPTIMYPQTGFTYDSIYSSSKILDLEYGQKEIQKLSDDISRKSKNASMKASVFRSVNILASLIIIILACAIGAVTALSECKDMFIIIASFSIAGIKSFYEMFRLGHRGIYFKYASIRLRSLLGDVRESLFVMTTGQEMIHYSNVVRKEVDQIEIAMFKLSYGPDNVKYESNGGVTISHNENYEKNFPGVHP